MLLNELILGKLEKIIEEVGSVKQEVSQIKNTKKELLQAIDTSSQETIQSLTLVINEGYNMHEGRIVRIENHLHLSSPTQE